jgi:hypothetical protein
VPSEAVEDGDATAYGEQQHGQQGADSPQGPRSAGRVVAGLCPDLLAGVPCLDIVEGKGDICRGCCWLLRLVMVVVVMTARGGPGMESDKGEAGQQ